jgi:hypothetical protein
MKKLIIITFALLLGHMAFGQKILRFGPRVAVTSSTLKAGDLIVKDAQGIQDLKLAFEQSNTNLQFGAFARLELLGVYVQPEFMVGRQSVIYQLEDPNDPSRSETREESYYQVNAPIMLGMKVGPIRLQGGPVYQFQFANSSDLIDIDGYNRQFERSNFDIRAGVGADLGPIILDLTYQIPLSATENVITIEGFGDYQVNQPRGHLVGSLGFAF